MFRAFAIITAFVVGGGLVCLADDPPPAAKTAKVAPAQPGFPVQPGAKGQPNPNPNTNPFRTVTATTLATYEEAAEVLDAQLDIKKAYVKAAEAGLTGTKIKMDNIVRLTKNNVVSTNEVDLVRAEMDGAVAQLEIRKAEMKEIEVKLKYAKKRLEDAKNAPARTPARPAVEPKSIDPKP